MFKDKQNTTEAIIGLIKTLPKEEQSKISEMLSNSGRVVHDIDEEDYARKLKKFNSFVKKNRFDLPKDYQFSREEAHERI